MVDLVMVEVQVSGDCVTRNGVSAVSRMIAQQHEDGTTTLKFVSDKLKRSLHAGATIATEDMDKFCQAWLEGRGCSLNGASAVGVGSYIEDMELALDHIVENVKFAKSLASRVNERLH